MQAFLHQSLVLAVSDPSYKERASRLIVHGALSAAVAMSAVSDAACRSQTEECEDEMPEAELGDSLSAGCAAPAAAPRRAGASAAVVRAGRAGGMGVARQGHRANRLRGASPARSCASAPSRPQRFGQCWMCNDGATQPIKITHAGKMFYHGHWSRYRQHEEDKRLEGAFEKGADSRLLRTDPEAWLAKNAHLVPLRTAASPNTFDTSPGQFSANRYSANIRSRSFG